MGEGGHNELGGSIGGNHSHILQVFIIRGDVTVEAVCVSFVLSHVRIPRVLYFLVGWLPESDLEGGRGSP